MNKGKIENFDRPYSLLKDKTSIFHELIFNLEKSEAYRLVQIAKFNFSNDEQQLNEVEDEKSTIEDQKNDTILNTDCNETDALLPEK